MAAAALRTGSVVTTSVNRLSSSSSSSSRRPRRAACVADGGDDAATASPVAAVGTPVKKTSVLVVGGTGTLGRQVVRRLLDDGYDVRCLVRPRPLPADFLRDWGASTVQADLTEPETIPAALVGIHTIIDCATSRPEESALKVDWEGKVALIQTAKAMGIQRYVFFSINRCDEHPEVPLMKMKKHVEDYLVESGLNHTTIRLCGFMQGLIGQYAVPILDEQQVWGTSDGNKIAYMDTVDVAKMTTAVLRKDETIGKTMTFSGPKSYSSADIVDMCVKLSGSNDDPKITSVPIALLKVTRAVTSFFQWTRDVADRLAFSEVLASEKDFSAPMGDTYALLGMQESEVSTVEDYMGEYYSKILKKLKSIRAESKQTDFYL